MAHRRGMLAWGRAPPRRTELTPKSLSPVVIHELGAESAVPTAVVIEMAQPIVDRNAVGSPSTATLKIIPETQGTLIHSGASELTFTPERPFEFDTAYQLDLTSVDTLDGVLAPASGENWCCVACPETGLVANRLAVRGGEPGLFPAHPWGTA